jgi:hypothetical protein
MGVGPLRDHAAALLARLDAIAESLRASGHALALIGLGSVGLETDRLDQWSDLDFIVVAEPGHKRHYLDRLGWLEAAHPVAWHHRSAFDRCKALMCDGVLCDFAVFEPQEIDAVPFAAGRVVWMRPGVDPSIAQPRRPPPPRTTDETWIVGEALACLLVGLQRWHRGEKLSALRLVQGQALERLIEFDALRGRAPAGDPFDPARGLESRQPALGAELPELAPGYLHTPAAARAILDAFEARSAVLDASMVAFIRRLAA